MGALLDGVYEGAMTYGEIERHGDLGLGTFNELDGEMVALDGQFYQLLADGSARRVDPAQRTPFAAVVFFRPETTRRLRTPASQSEVLAVVEQIAASHNLFYAIRLDGRFRSVTTRTVPRQVKPYVSFMEIARTQPTFHFDDCYGSIVGLRSPDYAQGISVAGCHLHFITGDRTGGGHVLEFTSSDVTLTVDHFTALHLELPETAAFLKADLHKVDQEAIMKAVEG
jgi:acetolactate decarboxylase